MKEKSGSKIEAGDLVYGKVAKLYAIVHKVTDDGSTLEVEMLDHELGAVSATWANSDNRVELAEKGPGSNWDAKWHGNPVWDMKQYIKKMREQGTI